MTSVPMTSVILGSTWPKSLRLVWEPLRPIGEDLAGCHQSRAPGGHPNFLNRNWVASSAPRLPSLYGVTILALVWKNTKGVCPRIEDPQIRIFQIGIKAQLWTTFWYLHTVNSGFQASYDFFGFPRPKPTNSSPLPSHFDWKMPSLNVKPNCLCHFRLMSHPPKSLQTSRGRCFLQGNPEKTTQKSPNFKKKKRTSK